MLWKNKNLLLSAKTNCIVWPMYLYMYLLTYYTYYYCHLTPSDLTELVLDLCLQNSCTKLNRLSKWHIRQNESTMLSGPVNLQASLFVFSVFLCVSTSQKVQDCCTYILGFIIHIQLEQNRFSICVFAGQISNYKQLRQKYEMIHKEEKELVLILIPDPGYLILWETITEEVWSGQRQVCRCLPNWE